MHKTIALCFIILLCFAPSTTRGASIPELLKQISQLQSQIATLQNQLLQLKLSQPFSSFQGTLRMGDQNAEVKKLQEVLKQEGLFCARCQVTGYFGLWTKAGLMNFQKKYNLPITGIVDEPTRKKLNQIVGVTQPQQPTQQTPTPPIGQVSPPPTSTPDITPPTFSISINGGAELTTNPEVIIQVNCKDPSGGEAVRFSNIPTFTNEPWGGFAFGARWTLSSGDGLKTVYAQCKDNAGNIATASDTIVLDAMPPILSNGQPTGTLPENTTIVTLSLVTNERATCRYSLTSGTDYDAMREADTFSASSDGLSHSVMVAVSQGSQQRYFVRCKDSNGNKNTSDYLIAFSIGSSTNPIIIDGNSKDQYQMNVLVLKYFPLLRGGNNLDINVTKTLNEPYSLVWQRTIDWTEKLKTLIEKSTKYLGYRYFATKPALLYTILDIKRFEGIMPTKDTSPLSSPDYQKILSDVKICDYVDKQNVSEVWLFGYLPSESKISVPFTGDKSNTKISDELPLCQKTYRVYTFNYAKEFLEAFQTWAKQIETELGAIDKVLFYDLWQGPSYPATQKVIGRCGSVKNPPNARYPEDYQNETPHESDCLDWKPDSIGERTQINCYLWGCDPINYIVWNLQNLPGLNNTKTYQGKRLRNWWDVHGDFDNVMSSSHRLTLE